jgi:large subunit ribosomal protein L24
MKIKKGDIVKILIGKDKGKSGKVISSLPKEEKVIIEGMNLIKKHQKSRKSGQKGQILDKAMPIHVSNVKKTSGAKRT